MSAVYSLYFLKVQNILCHKTIIWSKYVLYMCKYKGVSRIIHRKVLIVVIIKSLH